MFTYCILKTKIQLGTEPNSLVTLVWLCKKEMIASIILEKAAAEINTDSKDIDIHKDS